MRFIEYLVEALPVSTARKYRAIWDPNTWAEMFDGKYRIYLELNSSRETDIRPLQEVEMWLKQAGYQIINYRDGLCKKIGDKDDRLFKIGKVLVQIKKEHPADDWSKHKLSPYLVRPDIAIKNFQKDPRRDAAKQKDMMVVISRHPYDMAGMSTDRGWTSCMSLYPELEIHRTVANDIKAGSIIAYVIKKSDPNIEKPIARVIIRPYDDNKGNVLFMPSKLYGAEVAGFKKTIDDWLKQFNKTGTYQIRPGVYQDFGDESSVNYVNWGPPETIETMKELVRIHPADLAYVLAEFTKNFKQFQDSRAPFAPFPRSVLNSSKTFKVGNFTIPDIDKFYSTAKVEDLAYLMNQFQEPGYNLYSYLMYQLLNTLKDYQPNNIKLQELIARVIITRNLAYTKLQDLEKLDKEGSMYLDLALTSSSISKDIDFLMKPELKKKIYAGIIDDIKKGRDLIQAMM